MKTLVLMGCLAISVLAQAQNNKALPPFYSPDVAKEVIQFKLEKNEGGMSLKLLGVKRQYAPSNVQTPNDITLRLYSADDQLMHHLSISDPCFQVRCADGGLPGEETTLATCSTYIGVVYNPGFAYAILTDNATEQKVRVAIHR